MSLAAASGPLAGLKVLDLSRVLAGPWASQALGDLGADIVKVEQPGQGDDTRRWGPPFLPDGSGDSAYYLACNRNKRSIAVDIASAEGADLVRRLAAQSDIVIENFKVGGLARYGLDYASLRTVRPDIVYCSITGFGQDGPYRDRGGYDFLIQGMSGLMSVTGFADEAGGAPTKVGVPVADLFTGLYAAIAILAAVRHRQLTGQGQHIDCALFDSQLAVLVNQASNYLNGGVEPRRLGNEHPNVVPYQDFETADGRVLIALGNDRQFKSLCALLEIADLACDPRFADNAGRSVRRAELQAALGPAIRRWTSADLLVAMEAAGLPGGPVNTVPQALNDPQAKARQIVRTLHRADGQAVEVIGFPARLSQTPADYRLAPPRAGENTRAVFQELGLNDHQLDDLIQRGVIAEDKKS